MRTGNCHRDLGSEPGTVGLEARRGERRGDSWGVAAAGREGLKETEEGA